MRSLGSTSHCRRHGPPTDTQLGSVEGMFNTFLTKCPPKGLNDPFKCLLVSGGFPHSVLLADLFGFKKGLDPAILDTNSFVEHVFDLIPGAIIRSCGLLGRVAGVIEHNADAKDSPT